MPGAQARPSSLRPPERLDDREQRNGGRVRDWIKVKNPDSPADAAGAREPAPFAVQRKFVVACFLPQSEPRRFQIFARRDRAKWFFNRTRSTMGAEGLGCSRQSIDCARRLRARRRLPSSTAASRPCSVE
jgi:hypothetical protein